MLVPPNPERISPAANMLESLALLTSECRRALVVARANCVAFEYHPKDVVFYAISRYNGPATKSVLSVLVGIAIDEGYLRLDEKLSEIFPPEFDENVDPLARALQVRDLLTKTEGFEEGGWGHIPEALGLPESRRSGDGCSTAGSSIPAALTSVTMDRRFMPPTLSGAVRYDQAKRRGLCEAKTVRSPAYRQLHLAFRYRRVPAW